MKDELTAAGGSVDLFLQGLEPDAVLLQEGDGVDEMPEGAAEPIKPSDDEGVASAGEA